MEQEEQEEQEDTVRGSQGSSSPGEGRTSPRAGQARSRSKKQEPPAQSEGLLSRIVEVVTGRSSDASEEERREREEDPVRMLKQDHRNVEALFEQYEKAGEGARATRKEIVEQISRELEIHAQLEERIFYQGFKTVSKEDPKKVVRESFEEHKIVKTLLFELAALHPSDEQFEAKVTVLKESVEHHVEEEENELFPAAEKLFSEDQKRDVAVRMRELKSKLGAERADG
ncbi:MAG: hemerythrin domain-containing protein [Acidobacteriota bacterium]